jgi:hypothetical protein
VFLRDGHFTPRPSKTELDQHGIQIFSDSTPGAQPRTRPHQSELVAHLRQQRVDPSVDLVELRFFVGLKSNEAVERITRESPVPTCCSNAIQQASVRPAFHARRADPDDSCSIGCTEQFEHNGRIRSTWSIYNSNAIRSLLNERPIKALRIRGETIRPQRFDPEGLERSTAGGASI